MIISIKVDFSYDAFNLLGRKGKVLYAREILDGREANTIQ